MSTDRSRPERIFAPVLVVRLRRPPRSTAEVWRHPSAAEQGMTIKQYAVNHGITLGSAHLLQRVQGRRYTFARDAELQRAISQAGEAGHGLLMDDVFRLIIGMGADDAKAFVTELFRARPPIFSIRHGRLITKLPMETINANLALHVSRLQTRSEAIRRGLADSIAPRRQTGREGAGARQRTANHRADRLHKEIEKVRAELPEHERDNRSAIARALNAAGIAGPGGGKWQSTTVKRIEERVAKLAADE